MMPFDRNEDWGWVIRKAYDVQALRDGEELRARGWTVIVDAPRWTAFRTAGTEAIDSWLIDHTTSLERKRFVVGLTSEDEAFAFRVRWG